MNNGNGRLPKFQLGTYVALVAMMLTVIGFVANVGRESSRISNQLDRNCRFIVELAHEIRIHEAADWSRAHPGAQKEMNEPLLPRSEIQRFAQESC